MINGDYQKLCSLLKDGQVEAVAKGIRSLRESNDADDPRLPYLRALVGFRLALKEGASSARDFVLDPDGAPDPLLRAECLFVRALKSFSQGDFENGARDFEEAALIYSQIGLKERELLSRFNALSGRLNLRAQEPLSEQEALNTLKTLEAWVAEARNARFSRLAGLMYRQRSVIFQDLGRLHAAMRDAQRAVDALEGQGYSSDLHLAFLQASDVALDLGLGFEARGLYESLIGPFEARVRFARAYIEARLAAIEDRAFDASVFQHFDVVSPLWKTKFDRWMKSRSEPVSSESATPWRWKLAQSRLESLHEGHHCQIKPKSFEGRLIVMLHAASAPLSKALIAEKLWPQFSKTQLLDNRLHRLVSRVNQKAPGLVVFNGEAYSLGPALTIEP